MTDLPAKLRERALQSIDGEMLRGLSLEAADRINALEAENARLHSILDDATSERQHPVERMASARADLAPRWSTDMEAAPKDGTRILTFHPAHPGAIIERARRDNWVINEWRGIGWYRSLPEQPPVAWMPLPAPPKGET